MSCKDFVKLFIECFKDITFLYNNLIKNLEKLNTFLVPRLDSSTIESGILCWLNVEKNLSNLLFFYELYQKTAIGCEYIAFEWSGLSSGEYNLLSLYARIFSLQKKVEEKKDLIFIFDEADLSFHPAWQRTYVYHMVQYLNQLFKDKKIQIIIATHSPIMLSDALKGNVIFMRGKNDTQECLSSEIEETFGSNIYDLYREGLFLDKGDYGIIGEYANQKIKAIITFLDNCKTSKHQMSEDIINLIKHIGNPILKKYLMQYYHEIIENPEMEEVWQMIEKLPSEKKKEIQKRLGEQ